MDDALQTVSAPSGKSLYTKSLYEGHFRLLEWQDVSGQPTRSLNFRLIGIALDCAPKYDALSYRWQDPDPQTHPDAKVVCNGIEILVGNNLHAALLRIRALPDRSTYIWIDSVCIEQSDQVEKQRQILMMPQIYPKAYRVIIWLGESSERSDAAMDFLYSLIRLVMSIDVNLDKGEALTEVQTQALDILQIWNATPAHPNIEEVWRIYQREWFGRVWTLQEAALASSSSIFMCGGKTFVYAYIVHFADRYINDKIGHWVKLTSAIRPTSIGTDSENPERPIMLHTKAVLKMRKFVQLNAVSEPTHSLVVRLLDYIRPLDSTDDRDRILSLAAVLPPVLISNLRTQGPLSTKSLYTTFASFEVATSENLHCLSAAGLCQQRHSYPAKYDTCADSAAYMLPSWVPDWAYRKRHEPLWALDADLFEARGYHLYQATGDSRPQVTLSTPGENQDVLSVKGIMLETVLDCSDPYRAHRLAPGWDVNKNPEVLVDLMNSMKEYIDSCVSLATSHLAVFAQGHESCVESRLTAIRKTIIGNMVSEVPGSSYAGTWIQAQPEQIDQMFEDFNEDMQDARDHQQKMTDPARLGQDKQEIIQETHARQTRHAQRTKRPMLMLCISTMCKGRRFFVTERGRVGMGPDILQKEDRVCVLFGACTPFMLRPVVPNAGVKSSDGKNRYYQLVGECYVHGLMDGEAMSKEANARNILLV